MAVDYQVGSFDSPVNAGATLTLPIGFNTRFLFLWSQASIAYDTFYAEALYDDGYGWQQTPLTPMQNYFFATRWVGLFNKTAALGLASNPAIFIGAALNWSANVATQCDIQTITATDVTLVFNSLPIVQPPYKYEYTAIGGAAVERSEGEFSAPTTPGVYSFAHGLTTAPAFVQFSYANANNGVSKRGFCWSRGYTNGIRQGVTALQSKGDSSGAAGSNPSLIQSYQRTTSCVAVLDSLTGAVLAEAALVSVDATHVTITFTTASVYPVALNLNWVAIAGVTCDVGSFIQPGAPGGQSVPTAIASPQLLFVQSYGMAASGSVQPHLRHSFGVTDGTAQHALWMGAQTGAVSNATLQSVRHHTALATVWSAHPTGTASGAIDAAGTIALTAPGFDVTWTAADATAREWIYVAFGDAGPGRIVVQKVVVPSIDPTAFDFTALGGLDPASFSLQGGVSQVFEDVDPGNGYGIAETPNPLYVTVVNVSNGSPANNISVSTSETVTVTVTNTQIVPVGPPGCPLGYPDAVAGRDGCVMTDL